MPVASIRFYSVSHKPKPKEGDIRETKAHGKQVRVMSRTLTGAFLVSGGRQLYEWISFEEAANRGLEHLIRGK